MALQTDALRQYSPASSPQLGNDRRYLQTELQKLASSVASMIKVMQELEARIAALGG